MRTNIFIYIVTGFVYKPLRKFVQYSCTFSELLFRNERRQKYKYSGEKFKFSFIIIIYCIILNGHVDYKNRLKLLVKSNWNN